MWPFRQSKIAHECPGVVEIRKLRSEWVDQQLEYASVMDKLAAWTSRQTARDAARVKKVLKQAEAGQESDETEPGSTRINDLGPNRIQVQPQPEYDLRARGNALRRRDGVL